MSDVTDALSGTPDLDSDVTKPSKGFAFYFDIAFIPVVLVAALTALYLYGVSTTIELSDIPMAAPP